MTVSQPMWKLGQEGQGAEVPSLVYMLLGGPGGPLPASPTPSGTTTLHEERALLPHATTRVALQFLLAWQAASPSSEPPLQWGCEDAHRHLEVPPPVPSFRPLVDAAGLAALVHRAAPTSQDTSSSPLPPLAQLKEHLARIIQGIIQASSSESELVSDASCRPKILLLLLPRPRDVAALLAWCRPLLTRKQVQAFDHAPTPAAAVAVLLGVVRLALADPGTRLSAQCQQHHITITWVDVMAGGVETSGESSEVPVGQASILLGLHELLREMFGGALLLLPPPSRQSQQLAFEELLYLWDLLPAPPLARERDAVGSQAPLTTKLFLHFPAPGRQPGGRPMQLRIRNHHVAPTSVDADAMFTCQLLPHAAPEHLEVCGTLSPEVLACLHRDHHLSPLHLYTCSYSYASESKAAFLSLVFLHVRRGSGLLVWVGTSPRSPGGIGAPAAAAARDLGLLLPGLPGTLLLKLFHPALATRVAERVGASPGPPEIPETRALDEELAETPAPPTEPSLSRSLEDWLALVQGSPTAQDFLFRHQPLPEAEARDVLLPLAIFRPPPSSLLLVRMVPLLESPLPAPVCSGMELGAGPLATDCNGSPTVPPFLGAGEHGARQGGTPTTLSALAPSSTSDPGPSSDAHVVVTSPVTSVAWSEAGFADLYYQFVYDPTSTFDAWMNNVLPRLYDGLQALESCADPVVQAMTLCTAQLRPVASLDAKYRWMMAASPERGAALPPFEVTPQEGPRLERAKAALSKRELQCLRMKEAQLQILLIFELLRLEKETGIPLPPLPLPGAADHAALLTAYVDRVNVWHALMDEEQALDLGAFALGILVDFYEASFSELLRDILDRFGLGTATGGVVGGGGVDGTTRRGGPCGGPITASSPFFKRHKRLPLRGRDEAASISSSPKAVGNPKALFLQRLVGRTVSLHTKKAKKRHSSSNTTTSSDIAGASSAGEVLEGNVRKRPLQLDGPVAGDVRQEERGLPPPRRPPVDVGVWKQPSQPSRPILRPAPAPLHPQGSDQGPGHEAALGKRTVLPHPFKSPARARSEYGSGAIPFVPDTAQKKSLSSPLSASAREALLASPCSGGSGSRKRLAQQVNQGAGSPIAPLPSACSPLRCASPVQQSPLPGQAGPVHQRVGGLGAHGTRYGSSLSLQQRLKRAKGMSFGKQLRGGSGNWGVASAPSVDLGNNPFLAGGASSRPPILVPETPKKIVGGGGRR